jgi:hypothetical protein
MSSNCRLGAPHKSTLGDIFALGYIHAVMVYSPHFLNQEKGKRGGIVVQKDCRCSVNLQ